MVSENSVSGLYHFGIFIKFQLLSKVAGYWPSSFAENEVNIYVYVIFKKTKQNRKVREVPRGQLKSPIPGQELVHIARSWS